MINTDITSPDANSYASEEELASFAELRGIELPDKITPLLIKAMDYLEGWTGLAQKQTLDSRWHGHGRISFWMVMISHPTSAAAGYLRTMHAGYRGD